MSHTNPNAIQTTGVYDENVVQANTVDRVVGDATLAEFKSLISTAYQNNFGGVIDGSILGGYYAFGAGHSKVLRFLPASGTNWGIGAPAANPTPISGTGAFASTSDGGYNFTSFSFGPIDGGAANEHVVAFGVTALSLSNRDYGWVTVKAYTTGNGTLSRSAPLNSPSGQGDTLFNFTEDSLVAGSYYTGFDITYSGAIVPDVRLWFDDIGFVTKEIVQPNARPVGVADSFNVTEDVPFSSGSASVLDNDTDAERDPLTASLALGPSNGVLDFRADGTFTYTPNANFNGTDGFYYVASDGTSNSNRTFVALNVAPVNDPPVVEDLTIPMEEDTQLLLAGNTVIQRSDVDGDPLTLRNITNPSHGSLTFHPDGSFEYAPDPNYFGADSFQFVANDAQADSNVGTVTFLISAVNDAPVLNDASFAIDENSPAGTPVGTVQGTDVDGDALSYVIIGGNDAGAFAIDPNTGAIVVANSAPLDFETSPVFHLTVRTSDPSGAFDDATVTISLNDVAEVIPIAIDVLPGDESNSLDPSKNKPISVALYGSALFDVLRVDINSLTFGATGDEQSLRMNKRGRTHFSYGDLNGDGYPDLVVQFNGSLTGLQAGDTEAILRGTLLGGTPFEGSDAVSIDKKGKGPAM